MGMPRAVTARRPVAMGLAGSAALCLASCLLLSPRPAQAILERAGEHIHDSGSFRLFVTNLGVIGNPTYPSFSDHPSLEWPAGTANEFLLEAGVWVGARDRRGTLIGVSTAAPVSEFRPSLAEVDRVYASFDGAPGTRRFGSTRTLEEADDDMDGQTDEEFLNGKDDDGDGRVDEDYVALGTQAFTCEYRDDTEEARAQLLAHRPLGIRVQQSSWVWSEGIAGLDRCLAVSYRIQNMTGESLYDVLLGFYADPDVGPKAHEGYWRDDRYSIETIRGTFPNRAPVIAPGCAEVPFERTAVVMEDAPDGTGGAAGGDAPGLVAVLLLDHTTHSFGFRAPDEVGPTAIIHLGGRITFDRTREEISDPDKYDLLARRTFQGNLTTDDHRFILAAGPFSELLPGAAIELTAAFVLAADRDELQRNMAALEERFYGRWLDLDGSLFTGRGGLETCLTAADARFCGFTPFAVDHDCDEIQTMGRHHAGCTNSYIQTLCPHVALNRCTPRQMVRGRSCVFVDADCDKCTPNAVGGESLVRWADTATQVSSRPVGKRFAPGDREVELEWDNAAELPTARATLPPVAGYRVWRADGWARPPGSSGPVREQWRLVAELPLPWRDDLPPAPVAFVDDDAEILGFVPGPDDSMIARYVIGRYRYVDERVANGFAVFYDVTPFAVESQAGGTVVVRSLEPRASAGREVQAVEGPAAAASGAAEIRVVPNPYVGHAEWDLAPNRTDPSGRKVEFTGLPPAPATVKVYTLTGDIVRTLAHDGRTGTVDWDLLSRNGQPVAPGLYVYTVEAPGLLHRGRLVIIK